MSDSPSDSSAPAATHATEAAGRADFTSIIRYAQCWEDADVLLEGLDVQPGDTCISIASAGDNSLSLLTRSPARVIAVDLNPAQLACVALRVAAYAALTHGQLLQLVGSVESSGNDRLHLYTLCRPRLPTEHAAFWDARPAMIRAGIGTVGKFEHYFSLFRRRVLPLIHRQRMVAALLQPRSLTDRHLFYQRQWDTARWRAMFAIFFSRLVMGRLGRDPEFFKYVDGSVSNRILARGKHALTELDCSTNPYLCWILTGRHAPEALPHALRPENFELIRQGLDRFEFRQASIEQALDQLPPRSVDRFNLSDIFEYMSEANFHTLLARLIATGRRGGRLAYWNMLVPRSRPPEMDDRLRPLPDLAASLHQVDKAFFYSRFVVEEIL